MQLHSDQDGIPTTRRLVRDMAIYSASSGATLALGFAQAFIIPAFTSVQQFGYWRLFFLYIGYAGFTNLGFGDGLLLRWAGFRGSQSENELKDALSYLLIQQLAILSLLFLITHELVRQTSLWLICSIYLGIFALNFLTIAKFFLQASIQFKRLSIATVTNSLIFLMGVGVLILLDKVFAPLLILVYLIAVCISFFIMVGDYLLSRNWLLSLPNLPDLLKLGYECTKSGNFILLGNVGLILVYTIDRLTVSWLFSIESFAVYSFAVTFVALIYQVVGAVSEVLFPYLMKLNKAHQGKIYFLGKRLVIVLAGLALSVYFPTQYFVSRFFPNYLQSLSIARVLLMGICFGIVLRLLQVNFFKIRYEQRSFFVFGLIVNALFLLLALMGSDHELIYFAWLSISMNFLWYIINDLYLHYAMDLDIKGIAIGLGILIGYGVAFWLISGSTMPTPWNFIVYVMLAVIMSISSLWDDRLLLTSILVRSFRSERV